MTLNDPTSVTMQNSFLIKNHQSANFEAYLQMMKKRKTGQNQATKDIAASTINQRDNAESPSLFAVSAKKDTPAQFERQLTVMSPGKMRTDVCGSVKGKMPAARDGHTATIVGNEMVIFGGDRHRMPFSDTYMLNVKNQLFGMNID